MPQSLRPHLDLPPEDWEDVCRAHMFEYVDYEFKGRNDYGGLQRPPPNPPPGVLSTLGLTSVCV